MMSSSIYCRLVVSRGGIGNNVAFSHQSFIIHHLPLIIIFMRYRLIIAYDGTNYCGWQRQENGPSIQSELEKAAQPLTGQEQYYMYASGRTDAGVHARGQVIHFDMERDMGPTRLRRALNAALPRDIQVLSAETVPADFHARFSTTGKEYRYFIWNKEVMLPDKRLYATHVRKPMNLDAVRQAAQLFVGRHDYTAFSASAKYDAEPMRDVFAVDVVEENDMIEFRVKGAGFLYKMVRSISGFLIAVGTGKEPPEAVTEIFESKVRTSRVESAPACGLFLWDVWYEITAEIEMHIAKYGMYTSSQRSIDIREVPEVREVDLEGERPREPTECDFQQEEEA